MYLILVALNYQKRDRMCFLNKAKFSENGGCGYVLKPEFLRTPNPNYSPTKSTFRTYIQSNISLNPKSLKVTILCGQHIPRRGGSNEGDIVGPYVKVKIIGHPDEQDVKFCTNVVKDNGFNPFWDETFQFFVKAPAIAFLELTVKDKRSRAKLGERIGKDTPIGSFVCPINLLCQGK